MKLLMVLVLVALPLYCYAGSGCEYLENLIEKFISLEVSEAEIQEEVKPFTLGLPPAVKAVSELKQCFLKQTEEKADNIRTMMDIIYKSETCKPY